ncbi:MAG: hypothetical protein DRQ88_01490 [Epsilonproteobacteria bacterium]|nr:MAG: hypothetical protein DRQ89_03050 [Campylobacterota bacterium]RLA67750.1 MAG: hypothetical protein DRQ88_01490 [Campylobacterota bacterium]
MAHKILSTKNIKIDLEELFSGKDVEVIFEKDGLTAFSRLIKERFDFVIVSEHDEGLDGSSLIAAMRAINSPNKDSAFIFIGESDGPEDCYTFLPSELDEIKDLFELLLKSKTKDNMTTGFSLSSRGRLRKILFVDDDKEMHPLIQKGLKSIYNIESLICSSGQEALDKLLLFGPDLIILDVMMPYISGTELVKKLKEKEETKDIPVIFFTAKEKIKELEELLEMGPIGLILKPVNPKTMSYEIQEIWNEA